jgi:ppGpp synthetase/RelA/SpoT-type nucleotidyltranferase
MGGLGAEDIQAAVVRYERELDRYAKLSEAVYERCLEIVDETGVRATVQRRTKSPQSLRKKLLRIQRRVPPDPRFRDVEGIFTHMGDLAGVRIATYLESDRARIVEELRTSFEFLAGDAEHPNPDDKNKAGRAKHYRAVHCQVLLRAPALAGTYANLAGTACEIQVCSMLAHVWNEIEHDLGYKPETGTLSERELDCLDAFGQLARAGDVVIKTLLEANHERVADSESPFGSHIDFITRMQKHFPTATAFHQNAAQLFDVMLELGYDRPSKIQTELLGGNALQRSQELLKGLEIHLQETRDDVVAVDGATSDQLAVLLLDKKSKELIDLYPAGRGMGRPMRLVSLAKRFAAMRLQGSVGRSAVV